ncbi:MAG: SusD/RagB family nutrient-binding outer membrane lipoprotein [Bacteroidetes bacterium]|nr:SusD/RagB family nutrient-binding outer membrane lipoprotein [Bacteroidota bacterium]
MNLKLFIAVGAISLFILSCTKDFDEINSNPNVAEKVEPDYLFPYAISESADLLYRIDFDAGWTYGMYWTVSGGAFPRLGYTDNTLRDWWRRFYERPLLSLDHIELQFGEDPNYTNRVAISNIWESYLYSQMVSYWGPVPYSQALNGEENVPYDDEASIFASLLDSLKIAAETLDENGDTYSSKADLIFAGDIAKWKKFANSLRFRLAMQVSKAAPELAEANITELLADEEALMVSNEDNALFQWYEGSQQWNPMYQQFVYSPIFRKLNVSEFMMMFMLPYEDPRLSVYAEPAATTGDFSGRPLSHSSIPQGVFVETNPHSGLSENDYSIPGSMWFAEDAFFAIMNFDEICFLKAEAAILGYNTAKNPQDYYYEGIDASLLRLGKEGKAEIYKATKGIKWGTRGEGMTDWLGNYSSEIKNVYKQIIVQRWLATYPRGMDVWSLFRRTDLIELPILYSANPENKEMPINARIPERFKYPSEERIYNADGYDGGLQALGAGDLQYTELWFAK